MITPTVLAEHRIALREFEAHYRTKYQSPARKALYFGVREGVVPMLRKYRSKQIERRIEAAQQLVVGRFEHAGGSYIGVTRDMGGTLSFEPELVFRCPPNTEASALRLSASTIALAESYLPVPACPIANDLQAAVRGDNPWLTVAGPAELVPLRAQRAAGARPATGPQQSGNDRPVFLLGCGGYVREHVLPHFAERIAAAVDHKAELIRRFAGVTFPLVPEIEAVLPEIATAESPLVIIATYHSDHTSTALRVLEANANARVFVEKPPALQRDDALLLAESRAGGAWIDIGYNRRHAPLTHNLRSELAAVPRPWTINAVVKELKIPASHWYFWPNQGNRVSANLCHWIDLIAHLVGRPATEIALVSSGDTVNLSLLFADGTLASIAGTDLGDDLPGVTERLEVRGGSTTIVLDDYRGLTVSANGRLRAHTHVRRNKGHSAMYADLRKRWLAGAPPLYPADDILTVSDIVTASADMFALGTGSRRFAAGQGSLLSLELAAG